ncbi:hypothetical protein NCAS_0G01670 [Naumovozyma castellii]|uniref:Uncharacterized protein n=1 Tax=Naumovozyma castellii TaxID=27288 RepID=G0VI20_NAUCA|nr:hypothetical protein NCAS_0G01670 [Naumovozyma castellii CBS 4309]CCC71054.1 hypothetical protein NCAS_0G01670 [Naumovozyma castellii CBS 4309]
MKQETKPNTRRRVRHPSTQKKEFRFKDAPKTVPPRIETVEIGTQTKSTIAVALDSIFNTSENGSEARRRSVCLGAIQFRTKIGDTLLENRRYSLGTLTHRAIMLDEETSINRNRREYPENDILPYDEVPQKLGILDLENEYTWKFKQCANQLYELCDDETLCDDTEGSASDGLQDQQWWPSIPICCQNHDTSAPSDTTKFSERE